MPRNRYHHPPATKPPHHNAVHTITLIMTSLTIIINHNAGIFNAGLLNITVKPFVNELQNILYFIIQTKLAQSEER